MVKKNFVCNTYFYHYIMYLKYHSCSTIIKHLAVAQNLCSAHIKYIEHTSFCPSMAKQYAISCHQQLVASFCVERWELLI